MNKQDLCKTIADMIHNGEYIAAHDVTAKDGNELLLVTFGKDYMLIVNKTDETFTFRLRGSVHQLFLKAEELQSITEEYKAKEAERLERERLAKIEEGRKKMPLWKEQRDMLDAKIREVEEAEKQAYGDIGGIPCSSEEPITPEQPKSGFLQKMFNARKEE